MYHALIMAGGTGTRLWPFSRRSHPKQALKLVGAQTMMQYAVGRLAPLFPPDRILVVTRSEHVPVLSAQVPELPADNFVVEPQARGTAAAIGLGAVHLHRRDPDAVMAVLTADHFIRDTERFRQALAASARVAEDGYLVTLGIKPSSPATEYGYIRQSDVLSEADDFTVFRAVQFIEKPDQETANWMLASGEYTWNSGMFIWRAERILEEFQRHLPVLYEQLVQVESALGTPESAAKLNQIWPQIAEQTIDYAVMERADRVAVIPVDIGWADVGSWSSLVDLLPADEAGNIVGAGTHVGIDTHHTLVMSDSDKRVIATIGVEDMVIVAMGDAFLVCSQGYEQEVREVVDWLKTHELHHWL
jgi:mannose-1-phosphate guanylyltransferase